MVITWQIVFVLALAGIIIYFLLRMRVMLKGMPGADSKMNSIQLVKNWQEQKAKESQYQNELRERARAEAKPEAEKILVQRYKNEAINQMTASKTDQVRDKMKGGLGIDLNKASSKENLSYMVGRPIDNTNEKGNMFNKNNLKDMGVDTHKDIFSKDRIKDMSQTNISNDKLRNAASNNINWDGGVKKGLRNENKLSGLNKVLYGNKK
jgi:hypothetical protein